MKLGLEQKIHMSALYKEPTLYKECLDHATSHYWRGKLHNTQDCFILTTHLALFLPFLQISEMLILCLGWFPVFPDMYFSLIDFH